MKTCCEFGSHLAGGNRQTHRPWDEVLFESENFVAVPTLGSLVEGWVLLVPRIHHLCIGAFSPQLMEEFQAFRATVQSALTSIYGNIVAFEHGPARTGHPAGCGVDHAHLHLVPWDGSFETTVCEHAPSIIAWAHSHGYGKLIERHRAGQTYLYYEEATGEAWSGTSDAIPSQFFRKVIARATGQEACYDWKLHNGLAAIESTIKRLKSAKLADVAQASESFCV